ncbi:MAG: hypothetical protein ACREMY_32965 [bacterium]
MLGRTILLATLVRAIATRDVSVNNFNYASAGIVIHLAPTRNGLVWRRHMIDLRDAFALALRVVGADLVGVSEWRDTSWPLQLTNVSNGTASRKAFLGVDVLECLAPCRITT